MLKQYNQPEFFFCDFLERYGQNTAENRLFWSIFYNSYFRGFLKISFLIIRSGICSNSVFNTIFFVCDFSERYVQNTVKKSAILVNFLELVLSRVVET